MPRPSAPRRRPAHLFAALALATLGLAPARAAASPVAYPVIEGLSKVRSFDVVAEGGKLHALLGGMFAQRGGDAVAYAASADGGKTWSKPVFVSAEGESGLLSRRGNDAQLAVRGPKMLAVWQSKGELPGTGPLRVALSRDGGKTWQAGGNPAAGDDTRNQSHPALAFDGAGTAHLAWLDDREENGNTQGLRYARSTDGGQRWLPEATLDPEVCTCCWNRLTVLPDASVAVLYRDSEPHDMRLTLLKPRAGQWQDAGAVGQFGWHFVGCPHCGGGLAAVKDRRRLSLHSVVWTGQDPAPGLYYLNSGDRGRTWSKPLAVGDAASKEADIAALSARRSVLAYTRTSENGAAVYLRRSGDRGQHWSAPTELTAPGVDADHPHIIATSAGIRVFWTEARPGGGKAWAMAAPST